MSAIPVPGDLMLLPTLRALDMHAVHINPYREDTHIHKVKIIHLFQKAYEVVGNLINLTLVFRFLYVHIKNILQEV